MPNAPAIDKKLDPALEGLEPKLVWQHFNELRQIPRDSENEEGVRQWVRAWAQQRGFRVTQDRAGNIAVHIPATKGYEQSPIITCQGHMDMICKKNKESAHDFTRDPIGLQRCDKDGGAQDGGPYVKAKDTTLGMDNGGGIAQFMALVDDVDAVHPPIELLLTVEEESTLRGAEELDIAMLELKGEYLLNLDTSRQEYLCTGCAGINPVVATIETPRDAADLMDNGAFYEVKLSGYAGGHSGDDIHLERGNPMLDMQKLVSLLPRGSRIVTLMGGEKRNAIPEQANAVVYIPSSAAETDAGWRERVRNYVQSRKTILKNAKISHSVDVMGGTQPVVPAMQLGVHHQVMGALGSLSNGVIRKHDVAGLPPVLSSNLGVVSTDTQANTLNTSILVRGSNTLEMARQAQEIGASLRHFGFTVKVDEPTPSWEEPEDSPLVALAREAHLSVTNTEAIRMAFHSFIECGMVAQKFSPAIPAVSWGQDNFDEHTTIERTGIESMKTSYNRLRYFMRRAAEGALTHSA